MNTPGTIWVRPILAVLATATISYGVIVGANIPNWYIVLTASIISFYFGHVNGKAEVTTTQAGEIAKTVLQQQVAAPPKLAYPPTPTNKGSV